MPKRSYSDESVIDGLTPTMIRNLAASHSYERGQDLSDDVIIDSRSNNCIEASISGKYYDITINYSVPIQSSFDISADCSCPDDRDGACKHICAVLLKFVDNNPNKKKRKLNPKNPANNSNNNNNRDKKKKKKYTKNELEESLEDLDNDQLINIIKKSLKFVGVQKIVSQTLNDISSESTDISAFKYRIYQAIHQLDRLRPSAQFSMSYKIDSDLSDIISDAEKLGRRGNVDDALQILVSMAETISKEHNIEGEVWKSIHGCGGIDDSICVAMTEIIENNTEIKTNRNIYDSIRKINSCLIDYGIEDYQDVLDCFEV